MPNEEFGLAAAQVNIPFCKDCPHIRTIEWKRFMPNAPKMGTVLTRETPYSPENPDRYEYPFPDDRNARLYAEYRAWARAWPNVTFAGRLGRNVYLDMDGAIGAALRLADELLSRSWNRAT
jgi:UDP-galactopyranose mutase